MVPRPQDETGEDICELHIHGGRAVLAATFEALAAIPGCRPATAGEFARRAFDNGKLDLTAAEGLADLIDAETDAQRRQALRQASGALSVLYEGWRTSLIEARALLEAAIDFSDEPDVERAAAKRGRDAAARLEMDIRDHLDDGRRGEIVRDGFHIVLAGPPNVGKSSLMNALARRDVAIVSEEPGTTRDILEVRLDLGGYVAIVADTAGLRDGAGSVEQEGIRRARRRAEEADLVVWISDATAPARELPADLAPGAAHAACPQQNRRRGRARTIRRPTTAPYRQRQATDCRGWSRPSQRSSETRSESTRTLRSPRSATASRSKPVWRRSPRIGQIGDLDPELAAEQLRLAADALGRIVGRIDPEDVLDQVFARFCIGK